MIKQLIFGKIQNMMDIKGFLLQCSINVLIKKKSALCASKFADNGIKNENMSDQQLAEELHKPSIKTFKKRKVQSHFVDNIWVADLVDVQVTRKFNKGIRLLMCY